MCIFPEKDRLIDKIIDLALEEDGPDITSEAIFSQNDTTRYVLYSKAAGIIAGIQIAERILKKIDPNSSFEILAEDGEHVTEGVTIANIFAKTIPLLKAERVILNFIQRMSGIATKTAEFVKKVEGTKAKILDTRKTSPGLRVLDKYAVKVGGGVNHRFGLYDMAMIKDNHIDCAGSIRSAVNIVKEKSPNVRIEAEARTLDDVKELIELDVNMVMLDNFKLADIYKAVDIVKDRVLLEASGGVTLDTVRDIALTGVDFISVGELTHSVKALDLSMKAVV
ncbi:MAG: carboxylating nicotinate-nucleotide diphosphorylase [Deferribacterota bacterium]|nr:carboxylating nicotinate-nucleotide diphosphorylase [Deferribacterota bacterium]